MMIFRLHQLVGRFKVTNVTIPHIHIELLGQPVNNPVKGNNPGKDERVRERKEK
jgi:hypothetical protein